MAFHSWFIFHCRHNPNDANSILAFLTSLLLNFLVLKFQSLDTTPFNTHTKTTYVSITAFLGYVMARATQLRLSSWLRYRPTYAYVVDHFVLAFGSLAVVSLASLLFPDRARPVLYVLSVLILAAEPVYKTIREYQVQVRRRRRMWAFLVSLPRIMAFRRRVQRQLELEILPA
nr:hypothetical protein TEA_005570 [Ipomoea batatas]